MVGAAGSSQGPLGALRGEIRINPKSWLPLLFSVLRTIPAACDPPSGQHQNTVSTLGNTGSWNVMDVRTIHLRYPITKEERHHLFKKNVWVIFATTFASAVEGTIVIPSLWLYVDSLGGSVSFYGSLIAAFWLARVPSLLLFGVWVDRAPFCQVLSAGLLLGVLGAVLYATAPLAVGAFGHWGLAWLLVSRVCIGAGSGMSAASQAFFATETPVELRTQYMGYNLTFQRLVTPSGPALNLAFVFLPQIGLSHGLTPVKSPLLSKYTYVGYFLCFLNLALLLYLRCRFVEPPRPGIGVIPGVVKPVPSVRWLLRHISRTKAWVSYVLSTQNNFSNQAVTWATPLISAHNFGWGQLENSLFTAGGALFAVVGALCTSRLSRHGFKDRDLITGAQLLVGPGITAIALYWGCLPSKTDTIAGSGSGWVGSGSQSQLGSSVTDKMMADGHGDPASQAGRQDELQSNVSMLCFLTLSFYYFLTFSAQIPANIGASLPSNLLAVVSCNVPQPCLLQLCMWAVTQNSNRYLHKIGWRSTSRLVPSDSARLHGDGACGCRPTGGLGVRQMGSLHFVGGCVGILGAAVWAALVQLACMAPDRDRAAPQTQSLKRVHSRWGIAHTTDRCVTQVPHNDASALAGGQGSQF